MRDLRQRANDMTTERAGVSGLGWRALLLIVLFWTMFAGVTVANTLLSPVGPPRPLRPGFVGLVFLGAYTWAALTPPVLWLIERYNVERGDRVRRVAVFSFAALGLALLVSAALGWVGSVVIEVPGRGRTLSRTEWILTLVRFRFLSDLMASLLVLAAGMAYDYFRRYQIRQEEATLLRAQLVEARLEVLRTQLNPHFLFNTLNAVSGLVAKDPKGVRRMIARLSEVLRYSLDGAQEQEVPLEEELAILRRYLEILEIRYQGRLETSVSADPDVLDARVPTLILQPLAENAMNHGVSQAGGRGRIDVHARRSGDELVLTVRDTGAGLEAEPTAPARGMGGMGLRHTRQRLEQLYGPAHRLQLSPSPAGGMVAEIALPYHTTPGREEAPRA